MNLNTQAAPYFIMGAECHGIGGMNIQPVCFNGLLLFRGLHIIGKPSNHCNIFRANEAFSHKA
jgi:hypothetical protein